MLSVILPTRNEPLIQDLVTAIHRVLKGRQHEIVIIDKSDRLPTVRGARVYKQESNGLGHAVLEGVRKSKGQEVVVMDADFSHDPKDIPTLIQALKTKDFVIGSRYCKGGSTEDKERRYGIFPNSAISKIYCSLASTLLRLHVKDSMNGFAIARREVYDKVKLNPRGYKIHMETAFKAKRMGFRVGEAPTTFHKRKAGKSNTGMSEAFRTLRFIFELRFGAR